jgi:hypothetical protein
VIAELHFNPSHSAAVPQAAELIARAVDIVSEPVIRPPLIRGRI